MPLVSNETYIYIFFGIFALFLIKEKMWRGLLISFGALGLVFFSDYLCARILKPYFGRLRPYYTVSDLYVYRHGKYKFLQKPLPPEKRFSLPSCHATNVSCAAMVFTRVMPNFSPFFWSAALLVGYSRVYLGVHYPFDVLFGLVLGSLVGFVGSSVGKFFWSLVKKR